MKIVIAGGTGQVGAVIRRALRSQHDLLVLTRSHDLDSVDRTVYWDGKNPGPWAAELEEADVIINLAGRSVNCRYGSRNRRDIVESRVSSTRAIGFALKQVKKPPALWLQASTATIYAHRFDVPNDEVTGIIGGEESNAPNTWRFSIDVAKAWEAAVQNVGPLPNTRVVLMRSAMIMSPDQGGIFAVLRRLARLGLGGRAGSGRQYVSWIHEQDFVRVIETLFVDESLSGPINVCSPNPLPNADFMKILRRACGAPIGLPATKWMLEVGAFFIRTETELILKSRRVVPRRLLESGFEFQFPRWREAAEDLCQRY
ncbi:MAG: uncharacterized protein QOG67_984 [Verrucomicrobiota bacterium]